MRLALALVAVGLGLIVFACCAMAGRADDAMARAMADRTRPGPDPMTLDDHVAVDALARDAQESLRGSPDVGGSGPTLPR